MDCIQLNATDRQLLLYDIFMGSEQISYQDIISRLPVGRKMIQRDRKVLTDAGLICVRYARKQRAYVHTGQEPVFNEQAKGKYRMHLVKLRRIAALMTGLYMDTNSYYEDDGDDYYSCKTSYYEMFPDATERMRQRDFEQLNRIGYTIRYDNTDRRYKMWDGCRLREAFGVYLEHGKLMRCLDTKYDL